MRKSSVMLFAALALCAAQAFASNTHTVTFRRMNGTVLSKVEVEHGANATSLVPAGPDESANDLSFSRWDFVDKLACVTNDVTCWALYEATAAKSPSTSIQSKPVVDRGLPYSLDEYFQMYDNLAWSDEFSGTSLDTGRKYSYWGQTYYQGGTWRYIIDHTNNELQQYTEGDNVTLSNGILKITARRETRGDYKFTSAKIATDGCVYVKYGRCEIRAKLTKQQGTWPAFWMIRNDPSHGFYSELDIMEQINGYDWIGGCFHRDIRNSTSEQHKTDSNSGLACTEDGTSWGDEFHRIGAIFNEFEIIWYVDDHIFKRMDVRNRDRYRVYHEHSWYVLLNLAFGGWAGEEFPDGNDDPRIANFLSEDYEIDYCRIYTNTTTDNTVQREAEPAGARLSGPVKATVWRGWQMNWAKPGSNYYMDHLIGREANHIQTALREYFARDKPDVVTFMSKPTEHTDEYDKVMSYDVPGFSSIFLSPDQGANNEPGYFGTTRERLLSGVMFNKERFSTSRSAISSLPISNEADFTNCCAVVAELVENDTGAKVKVVSVNVIRTNGVDNANGVAGQAFSTLMSKLDAMKDEKVILFLQGESWNNLSYIDNRVKTELRPSFSKLGQFTSAWPANQSAWVTANYAASAENPAPLTLNTSNVYTNQAYCATVQFEAPAQDPVDPDRILYVPVAAGATNTLDAALVTSYVTNIVKQGSGTLVASAIPDYTGTITVEGGVWQGGASAGDFGGEGTVIDVKDGASLVVVGANGDCPVANSLSGKTVNLYGAKCASANGKVEVLGNGSAAIALGENVVFNLKNSDSLLYFANGNAWDFANVKSGTVDLGGKTLTVQSNWKQFQTGLSFVNGGTLKLLNTALYVGADGMCPSFAGTGTLDVSYSINIKRRIQAPGWTLKTTSTLTGNRNAKPTDTNYPGWEGPVRFSGNGAKVAGYAGVTAGTSNTVFNLKGAVSGSGTLNVGPGWLNLHSADNTYSGAVVVDGKSGPNNAAPILPGGGGIGLWSGAACFPNASSVTFTNTARLAFMDNTVCTVPNVKFVALAGETQSISGGVHTARSTMAGFVKEGAGTLVVDSPVSVTGLGDVKGGTLKIVYRSDTSAQTQEAMLEPMPQFASLKFASGTTLDLSDNVGMVLNDLEGSPMVTNSGMFGISGRWKLSAPGGKLDIVGQNAMGGQAAGVLCFLPGATFDLADEAAFKTAVAVAGPDGLLVAEANWILDPSNEQLQGSVALPSPAQSLGAGWSMAIGKGRGDDYAGRGLYLRYSDPSASGYAAWIAGKGITGANAAAEKVTNGIANGVRYAFDIDPATSEIGTPIIQVVRDAAGNPAVRTRDLAEGRSDVTFGILATEDLTDWSSATLIPMEKFDTDSLWKPSASKTSGYVFPSQMFFKYTIDIQE